MRSWLIIVERLKFDDEETIKPHLHYNRWLIGNAQTAKPPIKLFDTSKLTVNKSADAVEQWVKSRLT